MSSEMDDSELVVTDFEKENQINEQPVQQIEEVPPMPKRPFNHIKEAWGVLKGTSLDDLKLQYAKLHWIKNNPGKAETEFDPTKITEDESEAYRESPEWQDVRIKFRELIEKFRVDLAEYAKKYPVEHAKQMAEKELKKTKLGATKRRNADSKEKEGSKKVKGSKGKDRVDDRHEEREEEVQHVTTSQPRTTSSNNSMEFMKICKSFRSQTEDHLERMAFLFHN